MLGLRQTLCRRIILLIQEEMIRAHNKSVNRS